MSELLTFCFVGQQGTGKSEATRYLERQWGFWRHYPGQMLRDEAQAQGFVLRNRTESAAFYAKLRRERGADILVKPVLDNRFIYNRMVVDGTRVLQEAVALQYIGSIIVAVSCDEAVAYERVCKDKTRIGRRPQSFEAFHQDGLTELYNPDPSMPSLESVCAIATERIHTTNLTVPQYHSQLDDLVRSYLQ